MKIINKGTNKGTNKRNSVTFTLDKIATIDEDEKYINSQKKEVNSNKIKPTALTDTERLVIDSFTTGTTYSNSRSEQGILFDSPYLDESFRRSWNALIRDS